MEITKRYYDGKVFYTYRRSSGKRRIVAFHGHKSRLGKITRSDW